MLYVLDASALLNEPNFEFESKHSYITTPEVLSEWKSFEARNLVENALTQGLLKIQEANWKHLEELKQLVKEHGFEKLSYPDLTVLALAKELLEKKQKIQVLTDDYSIQNFLALLKIPFQAVIMREIKEIIKFEPKCVNCGKKFSLNTKLTECDFCGGKIKKKPAQLAKMDQKLTK
ncbi:MAG: hypothetical protein Q7S92_00650 [Candidatus Diapherotrites archaeon]|nr:hypothetical protein [Candidatus Diapherotrites archaeon]